MPRLARRLLAAIALAVTLGVAGGVAVPGAALATASDAPVPIAPEEGAFLEPGPVVLAWTAAHAAEGYEVTWSAEGGTAATISTTATTATIQVEGGSSFSWQVRALPAGAWSAPSTFHADLELPTLPVPDPAAAPAAPASPPQGLATIPGSAWILGALGFAAVFLAVVVIQSRLHREQDA